MTNREAIKIKNQIIRCIVGACDETCEYYHDNCCNCNPMAEKAEEFLNMAINALERLDAMESYIEQIKWERDVAISQLNDVGVDLGNNMEEIKKAVEMQQPKTLDYEDDGDYAKCPVCGHDFEYGINDWESGWCSECGTKLDWEIEEAEDDYSDYCYECGGYGDDYSYDDETGEMICNCDTCIFNGANYDDD